MIVGMVGKARSGKDTFAGVLVREGGFVKVALADEIKRDVARFVGLGLEQIEARKDHFRATLQEHGSRMRREHGEDYWIKRATLTIDRALAAGKSVVVTDVRYENEAAWVRGLGGVVVRRVRARHAGAGEGLAGHSSEVELERIEPDHVCGCDTITGIEEHARVLLRGLIDDATALEIAREASDEVALAAATRGRRGHEGSGE
jgi:hypothetical protein